MAFCCKHLKGLSYWFILLLCEFMPFTVRLSCFTSLYCMNLLCSCSLQVTYHFFHWKKGTPFADDQGIYNALTWWEQIDNGKQLTRNRKFLTVVPVVLYLIASHTTDYQHPMLFLNTLAAIVLVVAKFPNMHKVRIFGINADK
ncbi:orm1-like protein 1 [Quercus suber]|uniref:Orm1-like protein 1 n=1 Tax=Quercus suber TaxID=58331 RepID=A0AAW0KCY9_QUESU